MRGRGGEGKGEGEGREGEGRGRGRGGEGGGGGEGRGGEGHTLTAEHGSDMPVCAMCWLPWQPTHLGEVEALQHKEGRVELGQVDYQPRAHVQDCHLHPPTGQDESPE